jgi:hypothetical protein
MTLRTRRVVEGDAAWGLSGAVLGIAWTIGTSASGEWRCGRGRDRCCHGAGALVLTGLNSGKGEGVAAPGGAAEASI